MFAGWTSRPVADKISPMFLEERIAATISVPDAERLAKAWYGVTAAAAALPGEYDCNFHLHADDGREFVLKIMHPAREVEFIEMQCAALEHLASHAPKLALQRLQRTLKDEAL